jgi:hypothetical protein
MARRLSTTMTLVLLCCIILCPFLALTLATRPQSDVNVTNSSTTLAPISISKRPILLTAKQEADLKSQPGDSLLHHDSHHLVLDYSNKDNARAAQGVLWAIQWRPDLDLKTRVRQVTTQGWGSLTNFTSLAAGIQHIESLEELHWEHNDAPPKIILSSLLDFHPQCKLFYRVSFSNWDTYDRDVEPVQIPGEEPKRSERVKARKGVIGSPNLYGLKAGIDYGGDPNTEDLLYIHETLTSSPNLRELDLSIDHSGCLVSGGQPYSFKFSGSSKLAKASFPPLKKLRLDSYGFDDPYDGGDDWRSDQYNPFVQTPDNLRWPWNHLPNVIVRNMFPPWYYSLTKPWEPKPKPPCPTVFNETTNLDGWLERMDFSKLESLDLASVSSATLHKLRPVLTSLESLAIHHAGECASKETPSFLKNSTRPLNHLKLRNIHFDDFEGFSEMLATVHGPSLQSLVLFENGETIAETSTGNATNSTEETPTFSNRRLYFNASRLAYLNRASPNISALEIDMNRSLSNADQFKLSEALGSFQNLSQLTLRLASPTWQDMADRNCTSLWDSQCYRLPLRDPLVNTTWARDMFANMRLKQARVSQGSAPLTKFEVIVGPWDDRYESSMLGPDRVVSGRLECKSEADRFELDANSCQGRLTWPYYYGGMDDEYIDGYYDHDLDLG